MESNSYSSDPAVEAIRRASQVYDPIAVLREQSEALVVARVGMKNTQRFMILNAAGEPAWNHEPLSSLSDVAWALRAHQWHVALVEPAGHNERPAKTLARLLKERA
jgi:hypothetical protein